MDNIQFSCNYCGNTWKQEYFPYMMEDYYITRCPKCNDRNVEKALYNRDIFGYDYKRGKYEDTS